MEFFLLGIFCLEFFSLVIGGTLLLGIFSCMELGEYSYLEFFLLGILYLELGEYSYSEFFLLGIGGILLLGIFLAWNLWNTLACDP